MEYRANKGVMIATGKTNLFRGRISHNLTPRAKDSGDLLLYAREYDQAIKQFQRAINMDQLILPYPASAEPWVGSMNFVARMSKPWLNLSRQQEVRTQGLSDEVRLDERMRQMALR